MAAAKWQLAIRYHFQKSLQGKRGEDTNGYIQSSYCDTSEPCIVFAQSTETTKD